MKGDDMDRVLSRRLKSLEEPAKRELVRETVERAGSRFKPELCQLLVDELSRGNDAVPEEWLSTLPDTSNGAWLRTQLSSDAAAQARSWERFFSFSQQRAPLDLLSWARALNASGAYEKAAQRLRIALSDAGSTVLARAEKLVDELAVRAPSHSRQSKIAVLGSSTTHFFVKTLEALCFRDRIGVEIYEAPFDSIDQEIRGQNSGLAQFQPQIVVFLMHWRDLHLAAVTEDEDQWIEAFVAQRKADWEQMARSFPCHIIFPSFDTPAAEAYGQLSGVIPGGRRRVIDRLNLRLRSEASPHVSILDMGAAQTAVGGHAWEDARAWSRYRQHPAIEALPALAEAYVAQIRAVLGLSRKVLVTDLDNTLWGGVIGEDGLDGIVVGPDSPEGEAHIALQHYLLDLKRRGILLAVCSKNNLADAQAPFLEHAQMALHLNDFAAFRANWEDKAANLRAIAQELSLGLDSFVFLDDNPLEREWVRSQLPEVAVVELNSSPFFFVRDLDRGRYFEALKLSGEDLARAEQYRAGAEREGLRAASASLDDFLRDLRLEAGVEPITPKNLARVTQLVNKTNQFNVTTRRYNEAQVRAIVDDSNAWAAAFQMTDRMGSYGLIGVLFCRSIDDRVWEIDTWLMSCRTLGRQMEKFMFDRLLEAAVERGVKRIVGVYRPTAKNGLVADLYENSGFEKVAGSVDEIRYELRVPAQPVITATHVRNMAAVPVMAKQ